MAMVPDLQSAGLPISFLAHCLLPIILAIYVMAVKVAEEARSMT